MAPALASNPFHLPATIRRHRGNTRPVRLPKPFVCAKKQGDGAPSTGPKGSPFGLNGKFPDIKSLVPAIVSSSTSGSLLFPNRRRADSNTVFVAGAAGQAGVRMVQVLLRKGFAVRAGVPDLASAQELARLAANYKVISPEEAKRLNAVETSFENPEAIAKAIGNAGKLVVTIGPCENGPSAEITTTEALEVVKAAELAGVGHVVVVYDTSTPGFSGASTYNVLDGITLFFNNLFSLSQSLPLTEFLSKVVEADLSYTLIKAALTDDIYADESYGITAHKEGTAPAEADEYKVSKSRIASLAAGVLANTSVAENKVVEVCASSSATAKSIDELFSPIPVDGRRGAYKEALANATAEEKAVASEKSREAANATKKRKEDVKELSKLGGLAARLAEEAPEDADSAGSPLDGLFSKVKDLGSEFSWEKLSSQLEAVKKVADAEPKLQIAAVGGQVKARTLPPRKVNIKKAAPPKPKPRERLEAKPGARKMFGGLFKQETFYMDDD